MAEFVVKMADERGRILQQVESANSAAELRERFAMQGFLVYDVRPRGLLTGADVRLKGRKKVKLDEFVVFNTQFVTLIRAGLPILTALDLLARQQKNIHFKQALEDVRTRVKSGEPLSQAFEAQQIASQIYHTTLLAGEKSGNLEEVLGRYITFQRISMAFRKKLVASLVYPALLVTAMSGLLAVLILFVVPKFADLYHELNADLPPITEFLLSVGQSAQQYVIFGVAGVVIGGFLLVQWAQTRAGKDQLDRIRMGLPLLGTIWLKYQIAMFSRMLSTLLSGGLPLVTAMATAGGSMESNLLAQAIETAGVRVREGNPLSTSLAKTNIFPDLAIGMVEVGESTGALPQMLTSVAEFYEEDVQTALAAALSLIEPIILLVMGSVVALVLISLYLPIFNLGSQIR